MSFLSEYPHYLPLFQDLSYNIISCFFFYLALFFSFCLFAISVFNRKTPNYPGYSVPSIYNGFLIHHYSVITLMIVSHTSVV